MGMGSAKAGDGNNLRPIEKEPEVGFVNFGFFLDNLANIQDKKINILRKF
jgi:hypothetical protein